MTNGLDAAACTSPDHDVKVPNMDDRRGLQQPLSRREPRRKQSPNPWPDGTSPPEAVTQKAESLQVFIQQFELDITKLHVSRRELSNHRDVLENDDYV